MGRINIKHPKRMMLTTDFTRMMRSIRPKKRDFTRGGYGKAIRAWQRAYYTGKESFKLNDKLNRIALGGSMNTSIIHEGTREFVITSLPRPTRRKRPAKRRG